jgi:peptide/nickel transport system ATP-binding protein
MMNEGLSQDLKSQKLPLIQTRGLTKWFKLKSGFFATFFSKQMLVQAVENVDFHMDKGEIVALVGETGCGKTTLGKLIVGLTEPTAGQIFFQGKDLTSIPLNKWRSYRKKIQIIFQNPFESLDPTQSVYDSISEPIRFNHLAQNREEEREKIIQMLKLLALSPPENFIHKLHSELSGGQLQRVAIARALIVSPTLLVADEPVSMLDVSVRASILNLLLDIKKKFDLAILLITHDLAVASYAADRIVVMYLGKIVEAGPMKQLIDNPLHPYTRALISSVPSIDMNRKVRSKYLKGETPSAINPPSGCRFHPRCLYTKGICMEKEPGLTLVEKDHKVGCHLYK